MNNTLNSLDKQILSRKELMSLLGVSAVTVWTWVKEGRIREHSIKRKCFYIKDELIEDLRIKI